jgi:hypothetical protein
MLASLEGHLEVVRWLLEKGADVNAAEENGWTALMVASDNGHLPVVKLLVEKGADVNKAKNNGRTALIFASLWGYLPVVKWLLEKGADVNAAADADAVKEGGWTALMHASQKGHLRVVKLLLDEKADVNAVDNMGRTALMFASEKGHLPVVKLLLEKGADVNAVANDDGKTAYQKCESKSCRNVFDQFMMEKRANTYELVLKKLGLPRDLRRQMRWQPEYLKHCDEEQSQDRIGRKLPPIDLVVLALRRGLDPNEMTWDELCQAVGLNLAEQGIRRDFKKDARKKEKKELVPETLIAAKENRRAGFYYEHKLPPHSVKKWRKTYEDPETKAQRKQRKLRGEKWKAHQKSWKK